MYLLIRSISRETHIKHLLCARHCAKFSNLEIRGKKGQVFKDS